MLLPPDRRGLPRGASAAVDIVRPSRRPAGLASGQAPQDEVDFWFPKKKVLMLRSPRQRASRSTHTESPALTPTRWRRRENRCAAGAPRRSAGRSEEHTSELQSLMRISYAVFCLKKKKKHIRHNHPNNRKYNHNTQSEPLSPNQHNC